MSHSATQQKPDPFLLLLLAAVSPEQLPLGILAAQGHELGYFQLLATLACLTV